MIPWFGGRGQIHAGQKTRIRARDGYGDSARVVSERRDPVPVDLLVVGLQLLLQCGGERFAQELALRLAPVALIVLQHIHGLQIELPVPPAKQERLIHHPHLGSDRD